MSPRAGPFKAVTLDAYGTLLRNEDLAAIPRQIVADHGLSARIEDVHRVWVDLYHEATQATPFRTLRKLEEEVIAGVLRRFEVKADAGPYVDLFFEVTTRVELYPETLETLEALAPLPSAVLSNADHEHVAAWTFKLPVRFILLSEELQAYKPHPHAFEQAVARLGLRPHEVLHVGDSDIDDVKGAIEAGLAVAWVNRDGRSRRAGVPAPDFELRDLRGLPALVRSGPGELDRVRGAGR